MAIKIFKHDKVNGKPVSGYPDTVGYWDTSYEGAVLETRERNGYDDSDFYAIVWDEDSKSVKNVDYATTRGWTYLNGATVDATDDVKAKAAAFYAARALEALKDKAAADARTPAVGKTVKVVKGRKLPLDLTGTVIWVGEGKYYGPVPRYRSGAWSTSGGKRVGFKTADGKTYFTAASNVAVTDPEDWLPDLADLEARAATIGRSHFLGSNAPAGYAVLA